MTRLSVSFIRLRFIQLYRGSGDLGFFRVLLLAAVGVPLVALFLVQQIPVRPYSYAIPAGALYVVWLVHNKRRDVQFLRIIMQSPTQVLFAEYFIFTLPVAALLLSAALFPHLLVFYAVVVLISFSGPAGMVTVTPVPKLGFIPEGMFEWQSGIRKNLVVLIIFYLPGLFGFYQVWLSAVSLLLLTMVFVSFYSEYEPRNMLVAGNGSAGRFLLLKIARHTGWFALLMLPVLLISLTHQEFRLISPGYYLAALNLLAFSILLKYYQYRPGAYSGAHQLLTTLACIVSVILPVVVIIAGFNIFLAVGAYKNINTYLDDRH